MALKQKLDVSLGTLIKLGGIDKTTGKANPTSVEGYFLGTKELTTKAGPAKAHIFKTATGNKFMFGKTNSIRLLTSDLVGQMVELKFTGMGKATAGKNAAYEFVVFHDEDNVIDGIEAEASSAEEEEPEEYEDIESVERIQSSASTKRAVQPTEQSAAAVRALLGRKAS